MFLATTALDNFWDRSQEILFLGEWCKIYSDKEKWRHLNGHTLDYHWADRAKFDNDYVYLQQTYERYLIIIKDVLNQYHSSDNDLRYYRIFIGPWLKYFIDMLFDRYCCLKKASAGYGNLNTLITDEIIIPDNFCQFSSFHDDEYNLTLYSQIIKNSNLKIKYESLSDPCFEKFRGKLKASIKPGSLRDSVIKKIKSSVNLLAKKINKVFILSSYLPFYENIKLNLRLRQLPVSNISSGFANPELKIDTDFRTRGVKDYLNDDFGDILSKLILPNMPHIYLESFADFKKYAIGLYPAAPEMIITANALLENDGFMLWCAESTRRKTKLIATQHGGGYGVIKHVHFEKHEIGVADNFLSWGWQGCNSKVVPFNIFKKLKIRPGARKKILAAAASLPRYSYCAYSSPQSSMILDHLNDFMSMAAEFNDEVKDELVYRLHYDYGWNEKQRLKDKFEYLKFENISDMTFEESLSGSKLFICTYNATTFLETFSCNFPTILFWNPKYWELRVQAVPFYELLSEAGILFYEPSDCARHINEIHKDPMKWWMQSRIQNAKNKFCGHYARKSGKLAEDYYELIQNLLN